MLCRMAWEVKSRPLEWGVGVSGGVGGKGGGGYRTSQRRPSVAVCFFVLSSFRTRDWRVSDSEGAASWRSRTFLYVSVSS